MVVQIIAGCGGGGGGGGGAIVLPPADTTAPTVTSFTMPPTSSYTTVGISSFSASDAVGVTGYMVTESATAPAVSSSVWSASVPTSFTFSSAGTKTAYAWAKDAAGNVSISLSATIIITLPTTKSATLKFYSQSSNSSELINGFLLTVILPVGSVLPVDSSGVPLSSSVYLSGKFAGVTPQINTYDSVSRTLMVNYASANEYSLGEFTTVIITVPYSYVPDLSDVTKSFTAWNSSGSPSPTATATFTFN
jgi:hypothetical protein